MRKILVAILAAVAAMPVAAQETKATNDTIVVDSPSKVVITKGKDGAVGVAVDGKEGDYRYRMRYNTEVQEKDTTEWNLNLPFLKGKRTADWQACCGGYYINAIRNNGEPAGSRLKGGVEFGFTHLLGAKYRLSDSGLSFIGGLGMGVQFFNAEDSDLRFCKTSGVLGFEPMPEGAAGRELWLLNWQWNASLQLTQRIGKNFGITAGLLLHNNFYTSAENRYRLDGVEYTETLKHLKQRPFSYELMGSIGWKSVSLFCKYNPQGMFRNGFGPQFNTLSIGIRFWNF